MPTVPVLDVGSSELCYFCNQQLYVLERESAEGKFFHRSCFTCQQCGTTLRQGGYTFLPDTGQLFHCVCFVPSIMLNVTHVDINAIKYNMNKVFRKVFFCLEYVNLFKPSTMH